MKPTGADGGWPRGTTAALKTEGFGVLTCNVVVQEEPDKEVVVSIADPKAMFTIADNPLLLPLMQEADARLRNVIQALGGE